MDILNLYFIDLKYIRDLSNADENVASQSPQIGKNNRVYIGVVLLINGQKYCIPLSSGTKSKYQHGKSEVDMIKIPDERKNENGSFITLSVLNINNMIPVYADVMTRVEIKIRKDDQPTAKARKELMQKELSWCRKNSDLIKRRVQKVYNLITLTPEKNRNLTRRCCNFKKLEEVMFCYIEKHRSKEKITEHRPMKKPPMTEPPKSGRGRR